jgi:hypothetical protein
MTSGRVATVGCVAGFVCLAFAWISSGGSPGSVTEEPVVDHQPVECATPGKNARVCAYVLDDGEVKRVRVFFRAEAQENYYWSDMVFDGIQFCATLPVAASDVNGVDYYVWAIDDTFESTRTRDYRISVAPTASCAYPVVDDDPERTSQLVVNATSDRQGDKIEDFEQDGIVQFVPIKKP